MNTSRIGRHDQVTRISLISAYITAAAAACRSHHTAGHGFHREETENIRMKALILGLCCLLVGVPSSCASQKRINPPATRSTNAEQEILSLSREKWRWMSERKVDSLAALFHEEAVFVHMGATMSKNQELDVIRSGGIQYKNVEIQEASVRFVGATDLLLNKIRLVAVVGGNEITGSRCWGQ
jgi:hypothetical protein